MSSTKKSIRNSFRNAVFERDCYRCIICGFQSSEAAAEQEIDAHHIVDRHAMPEGGYVKENGITLCKQGKNCHLQAEQFHITGTAIPGLSPDDLYKKIHSSHEAALKASLKLRPKS